jgi:hypothetical protein
MVLHRRHEEFYLAAPPLFTYLLADSCIPTNATSPRSLTLDTHYCGLPPTPFNFHCDTVVADAALPPIPAQHTRLNALKT